MVNGKSIVFCLPGRGVSYTYLKSFVQLCFDLVQSGASIQISQDYSSMVNFARCKCLGANVLRGPDQIPCDGKLKYDWQLWIDSDIVFNTEKFWQLVLMDKEIAAGWYATEDGHTTSVAHWLDEEDFRGNGGVMNHETVESILKRRKPFTVDYTGFGWVLIKNGVFEHPEMKYPWFAPKMQVFESGEVQDMCGEDVSFCLDAKEAGFEIWCDPRIRVGPDQIPWDGKLKYDWQLWIDSDIIFNSEKFFQLVLMDKDIAAGWYATEDGHTTSVAHWLEEDDFRNNGGVMNHETVESISKRRKPFTVDYTGFGWVLIKKGVFENLEYPWFAPKMQVFESGAVQDMCGEDVSFCLDAIDAGYKIWCDPRIRVGHEKTRII